MVLTLFGGHASPPCLNVFLVARAINVPITFQSVNLETGENTTEEFLKKNPAHSIPAFDDNGHTIWESRAIVMYLLNQYAKDDSLYPKDPKKRSQVDNMLFFDSSSFYASICDYYYPPTFYGKKVEPDRLIALKDRMSIFNSILSTRPYAACDRITVADLCLINSFTIPEIFGLPLADYPHVTKWANKVRTELPYYHEVTKRGVDDMKTYVPKFPKT